MATTFNFYTVGGNNVKQFNKMVEKLYSDMHEFTQGKVSENEALEYCIVALKSAMSIRPDMYMWGLDEPENMPSDARVDYLYVPTYIITGIIMYCYMNYDRVREFREFDKFLPFYLNGCMGRDFMGTGLDSGEGFKTTMRIFEECNVKAFVDKYPKMNAEFTKMYLAGYDLWIHLLNRGVPLTGNPFQQEINEIDRRKQKGWNK